VPSLKNSRAAIRQLTIFARVGLALSPLGVSHVKLHVTLFPPGLIVN